MDQARHDLAVGERNFEIEIYDLAIVMSEQALEKALKALYIAQNGKFAPRTHSIEFLATETKFRTRLNQTLLKLQELYFLLRYPDPEGPLPYKLATSKDAKKIIHLTVTALRLIQTEIAHGDKKD